MEKKQRILQRFSLALKIVSAVVAVAIIILIIDFFAGDNTWETIVTEIHKGCYIECLDNNAQSIFYYQDGDNAKKKYIVEEWAPILKYATDGETTVAVCFVSEESEEDEKIFLIFNTETEEKISFDSPEKLFEFCEKEKIVLSAWQRSHCRSYYQGKED